MGSLRLGPLAHHASPRTRSQGSGASGVASWWDARSFPSAPVAVEGAGTSTRNGGPRRRNVQRVCWIACLVARVMTGVARAADPPADVEFTRDLVYGKGGEEDL